jgi:hypothetical protein
MRANRQDWFDKSLQAQAGLSSKKLINLRAKKHIASLISQYPRSEQAKMEYAKAKIRARKNALIKSIYYSSE